MAESTADYKRLEAREELRVLLAVVLDGRGGIIGYPAADYAIKIFEDWERAQGIGKVALMQDREVKRIGEILLFTLGCWRWAMNGSIAPNARRGLMWTERSGLLPLVSSYLTFFLTFGKRGNLRGAVLWQ